MTRLAVLFYHDKLIIFLSRIELLEIITNDPNLVSTKPVDTQVKNGMLYLYDDIFKNY